MTMFAALVSYGNANTLSTHLHVCILSFHTLPAAHPARRPPPSSSFQATDICSPPFLRRTLRAAPTFIIFPSYCYLQPSIPGGAPCAPPGFRIYIRTPTTRNSPHSLPADLPIPFPPIAAPLLVSNFFELCIIRLITPPLLNSLFAAESLIRSRMSRKPPVIILTPHCLCVEFCRTLSGVLLSLHRRPPGVSCSPALSRYFKCILQTKDFIFYTKAIY